MAEAVAAVDAAVLLLVRYLTRRRPLSTPPRIRRVSSVHRSGRSVLDQQRALPDRRSYMLTVRHALTRKLTRSKTMQW